MSNCKFVADLGKQPKCVECGVAPGGAGKCGPVKKKKAKPAVEVESAGSTEQDPAT
jgi:hypothetical protein